MSEHLSDTIPTISLDACESDVECATAAAQQIARACETIGFFKVRNHGVPSALIAKLRRVALEFFAESDEAKQRCVHSCAQMPRGLRMFGREALAATGAGGLPDLKEFYHIGPPRVPAQDYFTGERGQQYFQPNIWPSDREFREAVETYYDALSELAARLMSLAAIGLDLPAEFFADKIDKHITAIRLNYYPAQLDGVEEQRFRAGEHTDWGAFTILLADPDVAGLQVKTRKGKWVPVSSRADEFVVNVGDLLMRWTNDRWVSNPHRVVLDPELASQPRLSVGFFHHPNYDATIECIPTCTDAKTPSRYAPIEAGPYRDQKYAAAHVAE